MGIFLGLVAALTYGASDFSGGLASRRSDAWTVVVVSQFTGLVMLLLALPFFWSTTLSAEALRWGGIAGVAGGFGVVLLYRGLAIGRMSVVAPITALLAAMLPVVVGLISGERPSLMASLGVMVALAAIVLVSSASNGDIGSGASGVPEALGSGVGFGLFFVLLSKAGEGNALWPLIASKSGSLVLLFLLARMFKAPLKPPSGSARLMMLAGVLDTSANAAFLLASRTSLLSLAAVLTSLYPAMTILLARVLLHERLSRAQQVGLALAAVGVVLIAAN